VFLFWSDERAVPLNHPDSNYHMAMEYFGKLPIPPTQIFRMEAEKGKAKEYEEKIERYVGKKHLFDLVMLGVGEDGHTASLFPETSALLEEEKLVVMNDIPSKNTKRMTFTFPCIQGSRIIAIYALGAAKQDIVAKVLHAPIISPYPASRLGTAERPALWILDHPVKKI
jgi:6-phosphogluconolactonase